MLGEPPKDRALTSGERIAWNGKSYVFYHRTCHDVGATGLYEIVWKGCIDTHGDFVGACATLFQAETLLGARKEPPCTP